MRFLVNMFNHSEIGQTSLEDVVGIMGHQIRALGHEIVWDKKNDQFLNTVSGQGWNIVVEGFVPHSIGIIKQAYSSGARFIILATEEPTPKGFNWGTQKEMTKRQVTFPDAAHWADGIICLVPGDHVVDWYGQFCPTAYTELGYAPSLFRATQKQPKYDFGFYGSITRRRLKILKKLARRANLSEYGVRLVGDFKDQVQRDEIMRDCKVIVQIRKFEEMGLVSSSRCNTALCLGRPVVAEPHLLSKPWDEIVRFTSTTDGFYDACMIARATWRGLHQSQFEAFKTKLSPELCVGAAFDKLGIFTKELSQKAA